MFAYLEKFKRLPADIKAKVSGPDAVRALELLEKEYGVSLAAIVMKVSVKDLRLGGLLEQLALLGLDKVRAEALAVSLKTDIFKDILPYLGETAAPESLAAVISTPAENQEKAAAKEIAKEDLKKDIKAESKTDIAEKEIVETVVKKEIKADTAVKEEIQKTANIQKTQDAEPLKAPLKPEAKTELPVKPLIAPLPEQTSEPEILEKAEMRLPVENFPDIKFAKESVAIKPEAVLKPVPPADLTKEKGLEEAAGVLLTAADQLPPTPGLPDIYTLQVDACLEETMADAGKIGIKIDDADVRARLEPLLRLYIRGVRSKIDTRIALNRPVEKDGLGLKDESVSRLFRALEKNRKRIIREGQPWVPRSSASAAIEKLRRLDAHAIDSVYDLAARLDIKHELPAPLPGATKIYIAPDNPPVTVVPKAPVSKSTINAATPAAAASGRKPARRPFFGMFGKIKMQDIKTVKILSPVDELRYLDLVNFRRLGTDGRSITKKLLDKIKLLEKDGYDKLIAGIGAWRESPVNKLYLSLTGESAEAGRPLNEILEIRKQNNQETLTLDEIGAIIDLNKELNF